MKAVNLIPVEERRGSSGGSSTPTFGVIGVLALLLVAVTAWVVLSNQVGERKAALAQEQSKLAAQQQRAANLKPYAAFAQLQQKRVQTVSQLAQTRFDWEATMHDLARVVTSNVWLTNFKGTVAPGVSVSTAGGGSGSGSASSGSGGDTTALRGALPNPAVELSGCATSNDEVAGFVSRLRAMKGVTRVTLASAVKSDASEGAGGTSGGSCTQGSDKYPVFSLVIFFQPLAGAPAVSASPGSPATPTPASPAPSSSAPSSAGTSSPASAGASK